LGTAAHRRAQAAACGAGATARPSLYPRSPSPRRLPQYLGCVLSVLGGFTLLGWPPGSPGVAAWWAGLYAFTAAVEELF
jgi:hypothetical protein